MKPSSYRDMSLLQEITQTPAATQRQLAKRIGAALGLTNLMLRRLVKKGYIKISGTKRSRIRYLITPQGILEKSRLTVEFIQYSLHLYSGVRSFLRQQLAILAQAGHRRILLCGTGELAEIAFLTIREMGLELVGIAEESPSQTQFLGYSLRRLAEFSVEDYDRIIVASQRWLESWEGPIAALGIPRERLIILPIQGMPPLPTQLIETVEPAITPLETVHETTPEGISAVP